MREVKANLSGCTTLFFLLDLDFLSFNIHIIFFTLCPSPLNCPLSFLLLKYILLFSLCLIHLTRHHPSGHSGRYRGFPLADVGQEGEEQAVPSHGKDDTW